MPNQNFCGPREDLIMGDCGLNLPYACSKTETKLCKYSYTSWCPTCDKDSPRRRSRSETNELCKRRGREMKSLTPKKFDKSQECENMDLEYETKDSRYDFYRIRSNLCELPTTYITNNCQITSKLSNATTDFIDYIEKNKHFEGYNTKFTNNFNNQMHSFNQNTTDKSKNGYETNSKSLHKFNQKFDVKPHYFNGYASRNSDTPHPLKNVVHVKNIEFLKSRNSPEPIVEQKPCFYKVERCTSDSKQFGDFKNSSEKPPKTELCYDTCTFFDKKYDTSNLHDRYTKEVELLRGKLRELTGRPSNIVKTRSFSESECQKKLSDICVEVVHPIEIKNISATEEIKSVVSPPSPKPNGVKLAPKVTLKTKSKLSVIKVKKMKSKPVQPVTSNSDFSDR